MLLEEIAKNILSAEPKQKLQAIQHLKRLSSEEQVQLLLTLFEREKTEIRQVIINTLLELGKNISDILIKQLKSCSDEVRPVIVDVLSETLSQNDAIMVLNYLADDNPFVRAAVIEILGRLKDNWSLSYLRSFLKDPTPIVRIKSAQALGNMQDKLSLDALLNLLTDDNAEVKMAAIQALAKIKEARACESLWQISLSDPDLNVRNHALQAIKTIGEHLISEHWEAINSKDINIRSQVIQKLSSLGRCVVLPLIELTKHYLTPIRELAITVLGNIKDASAFQRLTEFIYDSEPKIKVAAINAISNIPTETALKFLINHLKDPDPLIVDTITNALSRRSEEIIRFLPSILNENDLNTQIIVTRLIGKTQNPNLINLLAEHLNSSQVWLRRATCFALAEIKHPLAASLLQDRALFDPATLVRTAAVLGLGKLKMDFTLPTLLNALEDSEENVKIAAIKAIGELQIENTAVHILPFLTHQSVMLKLAAIETITKLRYLGAIPILKKLARPWLFNKENDEVRKQAKQTLKILQQEAKYKRP